MDCMEFSRQEYWNGLPLPSPGDLPNPGIKPASLMFPALAGGMLAPSGKPPKEVSSVQFSSVQSLSHVRLSATPWTAALQASLSITNSHNLPKLMSIELVMPSNHLFLCCPLLLPLQFSPASGSFQTTQFFASGGQSTRVSASGSVLPMNIQD